MGSSVSAARLKAEDDANKHIKEQLDFLVNVANNKLDQYQGEIEDMFQDPASMEKKAIPGMRALRWERGYRVGVSEEAGPALGEIVNSFFGIVQDATSDDDSAVKKGKVVDGFKKLVLGGLSAIIGNRNAGQQEEQKFFIFMKENAVVRIDVKIWRYNFSAQGVMANAENVFCYIFCTSVVDSAKMKTDEFSYLLSEYAGDKDVVEYVNHLITIWTSIAKMQKFINQSRLDMDIQRMHLGGGEAYQLETTTVRQPLAIDAA